MKKLYIVAITYLLFGVVWIVSSDYIVYNFIQNHNKTYDYQLIKGLIFVGISAITVFYLVYLLYGSVERRDRTFRLIFDKSSVGYLRLRDSGQIIYASRNFESWLGYNDQELEGKNILKLIYPDDFKKAQNFATGVRGTYREKGEKPIHHDIHYQIRYVHKEGYPIWFELNGVVRYESGMIIWDMVCQNINDRKEREQHVEQQNIDLAIAQNKMISAQLNPHFMFNALNSIQYHILNNDSEPAINYLSNFARLIRLALENSNRLQISLTDEVEFLSLYIDMEVERFNGCFDYEINMNFDEPERFSIPPLIVQPYVENAIIHGVGPLKNKRGLIRVQFKKQEDNLLVSVEDNGVGRPNSGEEEPKARSKAAPHKPLGTRLLTSRLDLLKRIYGEEFKHQTLDIQDEEGNVGGTRVILTLPLLEDY